MPCPETINTYCYFRYLPLNLSKIKNNDPNFEASQQEWDSHHIKNAIKGQEVRGRFNAFGATYADHAKEVFIEHTCQVYADHILKTFGSHLVIVPIPNSNAIYGNNESFKTLDFASRIVEWARMLSVQSHIRAAPILRWRTAREKSHINYTNESHERIKESLVVDRRITKNINQPIILFDDVLTRGTQKFAAFDKLTDAGLNVLGCYSVLEVIKYPPDRVDAPGWKITQRSKSEINLTGNLFT